MDNHAWDCKPENESFCRFVGSFLFYMSFSEDELWVKKKRHPEGAAFACNSGNYWIASVLAELTAFFGRLSSSTPSLYLAWALASSTLCVRVKLRITLPQ